jgi:hypothetical protein
MIKHWFSFHFLYTLINRPADSFDKANIAFDIDKYLIKYKSTFITNI